MKGTVTLDLSDYNVLIETIHDLKAKNHETKSLLGEADTDCELQAKRIEELEIGICYQCVYDVRNLYPNQPLDYKNYKEEIMDRYGISKPVREKALKAYAEEHKIAETV